MHSSLSGPTADLRLERHVFKVSCSNAWQHNG